MGDTDKLLGAWSHVPILFGFIVPLLVWLTKKDSNKSLAFQAKQALAWQIIALVITIPLSIIFPIVMMVLVNIVPALGMVFGLLYFGVMGLVLLVFAGFAILGAWKTFNGEKFLYPVIGKMLGG